MFRGADDENLHIWIRRFDDEAHHERLYEAVCEDQDWQTNCKPTGRQRVDVDRMATFHGAEAANPMGRMATPQEVANAGVFLTSAASGFVSGTNLVVERALTLGVPY